jgi:hypothetical protein
LSRHRIRWLIFKHSDKSLHSIDYNSMLNLGVELYKDFIDENTYINILKRSLISIFPYESISWYKSGSSGRIYDSILHASFVIVPINTSLYLDNYESRLVVAYRSFSRTSLMTSVCKILFFKKIFIRKYSLNNLVGTTHDLELLVSNKFANTSSYNRTKGA